MAINRTDTPLATTSEPKAIDPVVKKTESVDPDTGVTTYKHTWSNTYGKKSAKPTTKTTTPLVKRGATPVKKQSSAPVKKQSSGTSSGERTFTSLPRLTPAGTTVDTKPSAPIATIRQTPTKADRYRAVWNKSYETRKDKSQTFDQWDKSEKERTQKNSAKNRRFDWLKGGGGNGEMDKNKSGACTNC
jgi:hypothetical protein